MSDNRAGLFGAIAVQISRYFAPLHGMLSTDRVLALMADLGAGFPPELSTDPSFAAAVDATDQPLRLMKTLVNDLLAAVDSGDFGTLISKLGDLKGAIDAARNGLAANLVAGLNNAQSRGITGFTASEMSAFTADLSTRLFDWSVITSIEDATSELATFLDLFGVIERSEQQVGSTDPKFPQFTRKKLHLDALPAALFSPFGVLKSSYGFGQPSFDGVALFARLASALSYAGFPAFNDKVSAPPRVELVFADISVDSTVSPPGLALNLRVPFNQQFHRQQDSLTFDATVNIGVPSDGTLTIQPDLNLSLKAPAASSVSGELTVAVEMGALDKTEQIVLVGDPQGSRLELSELGLNAGVKLVFDGASGAAKGKFAFGIDLRGLHLLLTPPGADGFVGSLMSSGGVDARFDVGLSVGTGGVTLTGSGSLVLNLPVHLTLGPIAIDEITIDVGLSGNKIPIGLGASIRASLGPFDVVIQGIGVEADLAFPASGQGNIGPIQADLSFLPPTGVGVSVDVGGIQGGGFLFFDSKAGRYGGALELSVYSISVKAIGLIETKLPDGSPGFSFIIIISAEFVPIQLGFGFTLLGVGGILGINRGFSEDGLRGALRDGSLDNVLFPADPVRDAPAIIQSLETLFPSAPGHFVFGPTAKLGWGTPTLIHADLGVILELPGPRLAIIGVVRLVLPSNDFDLVSLQLAILGVLDFPGRHFSLDASLFDSRVGSFTVRGDMAFRLDFGDSPNFLMSIGGFNPSYKAPPGVPALARVSIDLGVNGNPSLTAYAYLALTSNTAQVGAGIDLLASGGGIRLEGHLGFDAMFIFSPFSFTASISAGVRVSFHGVGFGIHLDGTLSGPTPWHLDGEVCVSILWWDACLGVGITFGESRRVELPPMDPWIGADPFDAQRPVLGLRRAIQDPNNWSGAPTPGAQQVVSLAERPAGVATPVDPVGAAQLRQKVVPLNQKITKFGEFRPVNHDTFQVKTVLIGGVAQNSVVAVQEDFVPSHFKQMSDAERLSSKPFDKMDAGFTVSAHLATVGTLGEKDIVYETQLLDGDRNRVGPQPAYALTRRHLLGMLQRSSAALLGSRRTGVTRYVGPLIKVTLGQELFVVADACTLAQNVALIPAAGTTQIAATLAIEAHVSNTPGDAGVFAVVPKFELFQ